MWLFEIWSLARANLFLSFQLGFYRLLVEFWHLRRLPYKMAIWKSIRRIWMSLNCISIIYSMWVVFERNLVLSKNYIFSSMYYEKAHSKQHQFMKSKWYEFENIFGVYTHISTHTSEQTLLYWRHTDAHIEWELYTPISPFVWTKRKKKCIFFYSMAAMHITDPSSNSSSGSNFFLYVYEANDWLWEWDELNERCVMREQEKN